MMMYLVEGVIYPIGLRRKRRAKHAADSLQRKRGGASVLSHCRHAITTTRCHQRQAFSAAADCYHATGLHHFIQPTLPHFPTRLGRACDQTRARARETFQTKHRRDGQIDCCLFKSFTNPRFILMTALLELMNARQEISIGKTSLGDRSYLGKVSESVKQIQQRGVSRMKLTLEVVGWRSE